VLCVLPVFEDGLFPEDPPEEVDDFEWPELFFVEEPPPLVEECAAGSLWLGLLPPWPPVAVGGASEY
jgi:hypothetical protein